jgi:hypothetical protein
MSCAQSHDIQMISLPLQDYAATTHVSPPAFSPIFVAAAHRGAVPAEARHRSRTPMILAILVDGSVPL